MLEGRLCRRRVASSLSQGERLPPDAEPWPAKCTHEAGLDPCVVGGGPADLKRPQLMRPCAGVESEGSDRPSRCSGRTGERGATAREPSGEVKVRDLRAWPPSYRRCQATGFSQFFQQLSEGAAENLDYL